MAHGLCHRAGRRKRTFGAFEDERRGKAGRSWPGTDRSAGRRKNHDRAEKRRPVPARKLSKEKNSLSFSLCPVKTESNWTRNLRRRNQSWKRPKKNWSGSKNFTKTKLSLAKGWSSRKGTWRCKGASGGRPVAARFTRSGRRSGKVARRKAERFSLRSPISGTVVSANITPGALVEAGQNLLSIINLDRVWIEGRLFELDIPKVRKFERATFAAAALSEPLVAGPAEGASREYRQCNRSSHSLRPAYPGSSKRRRSLENRSPRRSRHTNRRKVSRPRCSSKRHRR